MLENQFSLLHFIYDSHRHVFIVNSARDGCICTIWAINMNLIFSGTYS